MALADVTDARVRRFLERLERRRRVLDFRCCLSERSSSSTESGLSEEKLIAHFGVGPAIRGRQISGICTSALKKNRRLARHIPGVSSDERVSQYICAFSSSASFIVRSCSVLTLSGSRFGRQGGPLRRFCGVEEVIGMTSMSYNERLFLVFGRGCWPYSGQSGCEYTWFRVLSVLFIRCCRGPRG